MTAFWQDVLADICVGSGYGERVRDLYGGSVDADSVRPIQSYDDARTIDRKASAKTPGIQVRQGFFSHSAILYMCFVPHPWWTGCYDARISLWQCQQKMLGELWSYAQDHGISLHAYVWESGRWIMYPQLHDMQRCSAFVSTYDAFLTRVSDELFHAGSLHEEGAAWQSLYHILSEQKDVNVLLRTTFLGIEENMFQSFQELPLSCTYICFSWYQYLLQVGGVGGKSFSHFVQEYTYQCKRYLACRNVLDMTKQVRAG